jgi:hypothetical protein
MDLDLSLLRTPELDERAKVRMFRNSDLEAQTPPGWTEAACRGILVPCHGWTGSTIISSSGNLYGRIHGVYKQPNSWLVHRLSYLLFVGDLDPKQTIDHLCMFTLCWRPEHLEQVTQTENQRRAEGGGSTP